MIPVARFIEACAGFLLGTIGASAPVGAAFMCFAVLVFGPAIVEGWLAA